MFMSMPTPTRRTANTLASLLLLAGAAGNASANIDIVFDYTQYGGAFFTPEVKSIMDAAALVFESRITDNLNAITPSGGNVFNGLTFDPSNTSADITLSNLSIAANEVRIYMGASALGGGTLGLGGYGGFTASGGTPAFVDNFRARGQAGALASPATDFGPWGGSISFNQSASWYFDNNVSTVEAFAGSDFYSVAVHEIAHVLGMGTAASWDTRVNSAGTHFVGPASGTVQLSPDGGHWVEGTSSFVGLVAQEAAMDPSILVGTRKYFTTLDYAGLQDIGWHVNAVPEPATWLMWGVGGALLAGLRRRAAAAAAKA